MKQKITMILALFVTCFSRTALSEGLSVTKDNNGHMTAAPVEYDNSSTDNVPTKITTPKVNDLYFCLKSWAVIYQAATETLCPNTTKACDKFAKKTIIQTPKSRAHEVIVMTPDNTMFTLNSVGTEITKFDSENGKMIKKEEMKKLHNGYGEISTQLSNLLSPESGPSNDTFNSFCQLLPAEKNELQQILTGLSKCKSIKDIASKSNTANIERASNKINLCLNPTSSSGPTNIGGTPTRNQAK